MPTEINYETRLVELEIHISEQNRQLEELSSIITKQWKIIDGLSKKLDVLTDRFLELEEQTAPEISITKPPHW